ncbi:MAG: leucyl aminopeptidase [Candidatus Hydrogenedentes bacterium]|nr:leucyl aminopeptidase [Candidatus Hydrogenedentota bacterium]
MKVTIITIGGKFESDWNTALVIPSFEKDFPVQSELLSEELDMLIQSIVDREVFLGKEGEVFFIPIQDAKYAGVILLGLGSKEKLSEEKLRRAGGNIINCVHTNRISRIVFDWSKLCTSYISPIVEGLILSSFSYENFKTELDASKTNKVNIGTVVFLTHPDENIGRVIEETNDTVAICESVNMCRNLVCTPANDLTPGALAEFARTMCDKVEIKSRILTRAEMEEEGLNAIIAVGRGSSREPCMIIVEYKHPDYTGDLIALIGKGVTFDTGGICLKPRDNLHEMKYDMAGAGAVLGVLYALGKLKPKMSVIGVIPAVENAPGNNALLPGDIIRTYSGKTVEVLDTDAEGRLILADAISYAYKKYSPHTIIDVATLTGGCITALGHFCAGIMGNDEQLVRSLIRIGEKTGERLWELPLWDDYEKLIKSEVADIANLGPAREAQTIVGGIFLKNFIEGNTKWAHIDIAGTAWGVDHISYWSKKYPTGFGVRLLTNWLVSNC